MCFIRLVLFLKLKQLLLAPFNALKNPIIFTSVKVYTVIVSGLLTYVKTFDLILYKIFIWKQKSN